MATELARKLSPDSVAKDRLQRPTEKTWLYRITGTVTGTETGTGPYGDYVGLTGEFAAIRFDNGELIVGGVAYIPAGMSEFFAEQNPSPEKPIEITVDVGILPSPQKGDKPGVYRSSQGYEYCVAIPSKQLAQSRSVQRLAALDDLPVGVKPKFLLPGQESGNQPALPFGESSKPTANPGE